MTTEEDLLGDPSEVAADLRLAATIFLRGSGPVGRRPSSGPEIGAKARDRVAAHLAACPVHDVEGIRDAVDWYRRVGTTASRDAVIDAVAVAVATQGLAAPDRIKDDMVRGKEKVMGVSDGEVVELVHEIEAPRSEVWNALVDVAAFAQWYPAPGWVLDEGFLALDPRVGGLMTYAMHAPGSPSSWTSVTARFTDVVEQEHLASRETAFGETSTQGAEMALDITLSDTARGTLISLRQGPLPAGVGELARAGWRGAFDRLAAMLAG